MSGFSVNVSGPPDTQIRHVRGYSPTRLARRTPPPNASRCTVWFKPCSVQFRAIQHCRQVTCSRTDEETRRAPGGGRTHNLWLRRPTLYPVELRVRVRSAESVVGAGRDGKWKVRRGPGHRTSRRVIVMGQGWRGGSGLRSRDVPPGGIPCSGLGRRVWLGSTGAIIACTLPAWLNSSFARLKIRWCGSSGSVRCGRACRWRRSTGGSCGRRCKGGAGQRASRNICWRFRPGETMRF